MGGQNHVGVTGGHSYFGTAHVPWRSLASAPRSGTLTSSMRIVLATFGSLGDLHPYLAVAHELRARGHAVVIATHPSYRARVEGDGLGFAPVRPDQDAFGDPTSWTARANDSRGGSEYVIRRLLLPHLANSCEDTLRAAAGADVLVSHPLTFCVPIVAEKLGLPWIGTVLQPVALFSCDDPPTYTGAPWLRELRRLGPGPYRTVFGLLKRATRSWMEPVDRLRRDLGLSPALGHPMFEGQFSPGLNLALFSSVLAARPTDAPAELRVTGFPFLSTLDSAPALAPELERFLAAGPPPLAFTLGSSAVFVPGRFYAESAAAAERLGHRAVLLVGDEPEPELPGVMPPGVAAFPYAPHASLFSRCAAVVIHGGVGTTAEGLRSGRPMLFVPFSHDQPDNARRVEALGISRTIPRHHYDARRAASALGALLADPAVSRRAEAVAQRVRAERGAESAADAIESFARRPMGAATGSAVG
jgi:rhamnosyltransferase subunit B